ncbi:hypothetical protein VTK26DRAFT_5389 [Humicola hyalothermophila]
MDSSSRASPPSPLRIGPVRAAFNSSAGTPKSADSVATPTFSSTGEDYYASPSSSTGTTAPLLCGNAGRKVSSGSTSSTESGSSAAAGGLKRPVSPRKINANSYCGRHTDEFLFGGKGFGDLWRAVTKK